MSTMPVDSADDQVVDVLPPPTADELLDSDGEPMDSEWHRLNMNVLIESVHYQRRDRQDYYVGGNMFIYYALEQTPDRGFRGPDFFYVGNVNRLPMRRSWVVWQEGGRYPDLIVELLSPRSKQEDLTTKKEIYRQVFRTAEYFCYDPAKEHLIGWRLQSDDYEPFLSDERGWLFSEKLGFWLGVWTGTCFGYETAWLRFYDTDGKVLPLPEEGERERTAAERQRTEAERQRAEAAEAELARLRAQLAQLQTGQSE